MSRHNGNTPRPKNRYQRIAWRQRGILNESGKMWYEREEAMRAQGRKGSTDVELY